MSLELFIGPMKGGKSTLLLRKITSYSDAIGAEKKPLIINSVIDTRNELLSSHSSIFTLPECCTIVKAENLLDINVEDFDVIGIDESQFFPDLVEAVTGWVNGGKHIFCSGLSGSFEMKTIGDTLKLIPFADNVTFVKAKCEICIEEFKSRENRDPLPIEVNNFDASFSKRITTEQDEISVKSKYVSVCRRHF